MARDWIMVRVGKDTHAALDVVRESMMLGEEMGQRELTRDERDRVSLDQVIRLLIDFREKHRERARRSRNKRREKSAAAQPSDSTAAADDAGDQAAAADDAGDQAAAADDQGGLDQVTEK